MQCLLLVEGIPSHGALLPLPSLHGSPAERLIPLLPGHGVGLLECGVMERKYTNNAQ